ncbi:ubiquinol-cytochrome c reductase complex 7.3 kda protein [Dacryopinax primogenitus]|uniref:Complex III subunit 9 n=1 Tax=Dacryopinax primogenitus (strain DJM 731) TaxID=1858805 RepID=M5FQJ9_DACPD|nr:ubiquinol-cytochrome c reductase complex 7.3 kda protein [Dacryopinax primogenitus]EJT97778.1 ubiquinol-cytochrome c reductase complex 7.3 kda protein [Dacryopinax primogenitus]
MPGLADTLYNTIFRRNSVFVASIFIGAFGFGLAFDTASNRFWDYHNRGKQWKDIRDKYATPAEGE